MSKKYATVTNIEDYLLILIDEIYKPKVEAFIEGVTLWMDQQANRSLVSGDSEIRYFDGSGKETFTIDDAVEITALEIGDEYGETFVANTTFLKYPNIAVGPYSKLVLKSGDFTKGNQNIKITGKWGLFATLPKDIELACTIFVAGIINNQNASLKGKKSESIGNYSVTYADDESLSDFEMAKSTIERYKKFTL